MEKIVNSENTSSNLFSLEGCNVLITGGTGYFGKTFAWALAKAGAIVYVNGRNAEKVNALVQELGVAGFHAEALVFDVTDGDQLNRELGKLASVPIQVIVNNAFSGKSGSLKTIEDSEFVNGLNASTLAAQRILRALHSNLLLAKKVSGDATVINIASMYGLVSPKLSLYDSAELANPPSYGASKAALIQWTKYAACELGAEGIRVNCISPGAFSRPIMRETKPEFVERLATQSPLGRVGDATELIGPLMFLASHASSYVTGTNLIVDGGWTAW